MSGRPEFRKSQGVVPFGIGAIVDFPEDSLMTAGLDMWPQVSPEKPAHVRQELINATQIIDGRLQDRLSAHFGRRISRFLSPTEAPERGSMFSRGEPDRTKAYMPFVRFPEWHFCPRCRTLWNVAWNTDSHDQKMRCESTTRLKRGQAQVCASLPERRRPRLIPVRFAVACASGHIMDFPWREWAHRNSTETCGAGSGALFLTSTGAAGLAGIEVVCSQCSARSTMNGAFSKNPFSKIWPHGCPGHRPWLGPDADQNQCEQVPHTIQRGASNAYFAQTVNSILIPPYSQLLQQILDRPDVWSVVESLPLVDGKLPRKSLDAIADNHGTDREIFSSAVEEKLAGEVEDPTGEISESEYRGAEYKAFLGVRPPHEERRDFDLEPCDMEDFDEGFREYFDRVVLIPMLRETRVLTGFSRIIPPESAGETAALSLRNHNWLPAMEVRGEGVFLTLNRSRLSDWLNVGRPVEERATMLNRRLEEVAREMNRAARVIVPEFLLLHSLAHILIRQLIFDCGYDSSSLSERIYVDRTMDGGMAGLLIYTASGDSEGTLGGLVRQGRPGRLETTFRAAINNARLCSSDPLCMESKGQGVGGLNLSACHACTLLPETSCEEGNRLLDRATLIGTNEVPTLGFFQDVDLRV